MLKNLTKEIAVGVIAILIFTITNTEQEIKSFLNSYDIIWGWWFIPLLVIVSLAIYFQIEKRKDTFKKMWELCVAAKDLTPEDFGIQRYNKAYIERDSNTIINDLLKKQANVLIIGKPKIGKTRASYESIKLLTNFTVIKPKPELIEAEEILFPLGWTSNLILFLDDLERFVNTNIDEMIIVLKKKSKQFIVIATCRTGLEIDSVTEGMTNLVREFKRISIEEIDKEQGKNLADNIGLEWEPGEFDCTPGSVSLDLNDMLERYKKMGEGKVVLKAIKLMREANLFIYREIKVRDLCEQIFEMKKNKYEWDEVIEKLKLNSFVSKNDDLLKVYDAYLDRCLMDYIPIKSDLIRLKNLLVKMSDSGSLFYLGTKFLREKDYANADSCFKEALNIYPQYFSALVFQSYAVTKLGEAQEVVGHYLEAEEMFKVAVEKARAAVKLKPLNSLGHNELGYVLSKLADIEENKGENNIALKLIEEARQEHIIAIELKPDYCSAHYNLGNVLSRLGQLPAAANEYEKARALNQDAPYLYNHIGVVQGNMGHHDEAIKSFEKSISLKPDNPSTHCNLARLLFRLERYGAAEKEYLESIAVAPDYYSAYVGLGMLYSDRGNYEKAVAVLEQVLKINPNSTEALNSLGYAFVNQKKYAEAEQTYRKAISLKPWLLVSYTNLGYLLSSLGDERSKNLKYDDSRKYYSEALDAFNKALKLKPDDEDTLNCLGLLYEKLNLHEDAEALYKKVLSDYPNYMKIRSTYGFLLSSRNRQEEAIQLFKETQNEGVIAAPTHPRDVSNGLANVARALISMSKLDDAEMKLNEALHLCPTALSCKNMGILKEARGDHAKSEVERLKFYAEAETAYKKALKLKHNHHSARRHLANVFAKLGKNGEAEIEYKSCKIVYPKNNRDFGYFLNKTGRKGEAKTQLEQAISAFRARGDNVEVLKIEGFIKRNFS